MQSPGYVCPLNILACLLSLLVEDAKNSSMKGRLLQEELGVILEGSQRVRRDCHSACDPAGGSFHHHSLSGELPSFHQGWGCGLNGVLVGGGAGVEEWDW